MSKHEKTIRRTPRKTDAARGKRITGEQISKIDIGHALILRPPNPSGNGRMAAVPPHRASRQLRCFYRASRQLRCFYLAIRAVAARRAIGFATVAGLW